MFEQMGTVIVVIAVLVVGAGLGLCAGFLLGRHKGQAMARDARASELEEAKSLLESAHGEIADLTARNAASQAQLEGANQQLTFVKSQLAQAQHAEQIRIERERERAAAEAEQKRKADAEAAEVKRVEQEARLKEQSKVLEVLAPVAKNLDSLQTKVTQIEEGRKKEMGALGAQLKGLNDQQARLDKETSSLSAALRNNKVRGAWGEAQLKNIVESAGLLEHVDFDTQVVVSDADGRMLRPDMVVHLPGGKTIPIDAKVPYADYQRACEIPETAGPEELDRRNDLLRSHAKALREHVRALGEKAYWNAFPVTPDFVIAFIPNEALLQAALEADPTLMDDAKQLFDLSRELYERFAVLGDYATRLGTQITKTVSAYNKFASSLERRVLPTARKLQKLEPTKVLEEVPLIESDKGNVSELSAPEVTSSEDDEPVKLTASGDRLEA